MSVFKFPCGCEFPIDGENNGIPVVDFVPNFETVNKECSATWDLIGEGNTKGVFQLESRLGSMMSKRLKPESIEHLSALNAILRPGSMDNKDDEGVSVTDHYIHRKNKKEAVSYYHDALESILKDTYGLLIYQEHAMKIAQEIANFNLQEADDLRKAIGKKKADLMAEVKKLFLKGCKKTKILKPDEAEEIFSWIEKSQKYSFNASHAVEYAEISYMTAYLKAHFPRMFFASYLFYAKNKQDTKEEIAELVNNSKLMSIDVLPPSFKILNEEFEVHNKNIYFGIFNIKSIGKSVVTKIVEKAHDVEVLLGKVRDEFSWEEFLVHLAMNINKTAVKNMISVGCLDYMGKSRNEMLFEYGSYTNLSNNETKWCKSNLKEQTLIQLLGEMLKKGSGRGEEYGCSSVRRVPKVASLIDELKSPPMSLEDSAEWIAGCEESLLGISLTCSIVDECDKSSANCECLDVINGYKGSNGIVLLACKINTIREIMTKKNDKMAFLTVEDNTSILDSVVCFPEKWAKFQNLCTENNTIMISGSIGKQKNSLIVEKIWQLSP